MLDVILSKLIVSGNIIRWIKFQYATNGSSMKSYYNKISLKLIKGETDTTGYSSTSLDHFHLTKKIHNKKNLIQEKGAQHNASMKNVFIDSVLMRATSHPHTYGVVFH